MTPAELYRRRVWWAVRPLWPWRFVRLALRAAWLTGALIAAGGWALTTLGAGLAAGQWLLAGASLYLSLLALLLLWPIRLPDLLRRVDHALAARDQLTTAREIAERGPQNYVEARLLRDAEALLAESRPRLWQASRAAQLPWDELELVALVAVIGFAVYASLNLAASSAPPAEYIPLPPLGAEAAVSLPGLPPDLGNGASPFVSEEEAQNASFDDLPPATAQEALDALARALQESTATKPAGSDLAQGNTAQAAAELRRLAESARSLSPEGRAGLAEELRRAAEQLRDIAPEVAEALDRAADDLANPDPASTADALAALARLVEDLEAALARPVGQAVEGGGEGGNDSDAVQSAGAASTAGREEQAELPDERVGSEGQVVELPEGEIPDSQFGALQGPGEPGEEPAGQASSSAFGEGSGSSSASTAWDPLTYPWKWRHVVQGYFSTH